MQGWILMVLVGLELAAMRVPPAEVLAASDCEQARGYYDSALHETDAGRALALLERAIALCPNFNVWFVKGNAHAMLQQWGEALAAYQHAEALATTPKSAQMARAYIALMQHRLGHTCEAMRLFQLLHSRPAEPLPPWIREPYEVFELSLAETPMTTEHMQCALEVTKAARDLGVCPRMHVRIHFAFDSARLEAGNRPEVMALASALRQANNGAYRYRLVGHTDSRGSAAYNQELSRRRAASVLAEILALQPALQGRIEAEGKGQSQLLSPGDTERDHQLNRRVEVQVLCQGG